MDNEQDKKYKALEERFETLKRENENNCELAETFCEYIATHSREIAEYIADLIVKADASAFELACMKADMKKKEARDEH